MIHLALGKLQTLWTLNNQNQTEITHGRQFLHQMASTRLGSLLAACAYDRLFRFHHRQSKGLLYIDRGIQINNIPSAPYWESILGVYII